MNVINHLSSGCREVIQRTPDAACSALVKSSSVCVWVRLGVMPCSLSHRYVGRVLYRATTCLKNATASAPRGLPGGRQEGSRVL